MLKHVIDDLYPESLTVFRSGHRYMDMISLWLLAEKIPEKNQELYTAFVNLTRVFDTIDREHLWKA